MDFRYDDDQKALGELADTIIGDHSAPETLRALERSESPRYDTKLWAALADAGLLGIAIDESAGGAGLGLIELGIVLETTGRHAAAVPVWETLALGVEALKAGGSDPYNWIPAAASGEVVLSAGWHQRSSFDPLDPTATLTDGALTGEVLCVPAGSIAQGIVLPALSNGELVLVAVPTDQPTVTVTPVATTAGYPDAHLTFDGAAASIIGDAAATTRAYGCAVATQSAVVIGHCASALKLTATFTSERHQFGVPLASFQAVGHRAADSYIDTESIRLTTLQALWRLDAGMEADDEIAVAQYWTAFAGQRVVHAAVHLHGGVGVDRDYPLHRHFLALKQYELQLGGANAALRRLGASIALAN